YFHRLVKLHINKQNTKGGLYMELDFFWLGLGLAAFGYFIGKGLQNFKNPMTPDLVDLSDDEDRQVVREKDLYWFSGVSKEDAKKLVEEHPDVPHIILNGQTYYPREKLKKWLREIGDTENK